jgi:hypothetical protein
MPLPVLPTPRTWASLDQVNAPRLRADASDAIALLAYRPLFIGQDLAGTTTTSGTEAGVPFNSELADTWNGHNSVSLPTYYCQFPGWYLAKGTVPYAYTTATQALFAAGFSGVSGGVAFGPIRGQLQLMGAGKNPAPQVCDLISLSVTGAIGGAGDSVVMTQLQQSGGGLTLAATGSKFPYLSVRWVAALTGTQPLPVPPLAVAPSPITHAWLNANVRDTIGFLVYPPVCKAYYVAGSASIPAQAFPAGTIVPLTNTAVDNYGGFTTGASAGYTAPVGGNYFCYSQVNFAAYNTSGAVAYSAGLQVNGGTIQWGDSVYQTTAQVSGAGAVVMRRLRLAAGDSVSPVCQQSTSGALTLNASAANQTRFVAVWEGI